MAKGQKGIFVSEAEYKILDHSKKVIERVAGVNLSWGAYLAILSSGALATYALQGLELFCPDCGKRSLLRYVTAPREDSSESSPSSSKGPPSQQRQ
jgi:hypothetical protein